jgi:hypothetical protein
MWRLEQWLGDHDVPGMIHLDISADPAAAARLRQWTGHLPVPTLVIAADAGFEPRVPPRPLAPGERLRGADRGTLLSEPYPGQVEEFLSRNGIAFHARHRGRGEEAAAGPPPAGHTVTVYPFTGRQLFFTIPDSWCRECDLTVAAVERATAGRDDVRVEVKPWWNHLITVLRRGGWHAPVVMVDGRVFSQGVVPDVEALRGALGAAGPS